MLRVNWTVNFHKIVTLSLILGLMAYYGNWSGGAWVYLVLHGIYSYCWLLKDFAFRDHQLNAGGGIPGTVDLSLAVRLYTVGLLT